MFFVKKMLEANIEKLAKKAEDTFNTKVNEYGISKRGESIYDNLTHGQNLGKYMGYLVIPVDEDGEYLITKKSNASFDFSPLSRLEASQAIIPTSNLIRFMQDEFQGKVSVRKKIPFSSAPNKSNIFTHMKPSDNFLYLTYFVS